MSEKQFHINFDKYAHQIMCDGEGLSLQEIVKILNGQQASIEELKEENEQLKYDNFMFKEVIKTFQKVAISERKKLEKENEHLRGDRKVANDFIVKKGLDIEYYKYWRGLQDEREKI